MKLKGNILIWLIIFISRTSSADIPGHFAYIGDNAQFTARTVWMISASGRNIREHYQPKGLLRYVEISADGDTLLFSTSSGKFAENIYVRYGEKHPTNLTQGRLKDVWRDDVIVAGVFHFTLSSSERSVAVAGGEHGAFVIDLATKEMTKFSEEPVYWVEWSPSPREEEIVISVLVDRPRDERQLWMVNWRSGEKRYLTDGHYADWSPRGDFIVFSRGKAKSSRIFKIRPDGTDEQLLSDKNNFVTSLGYHIYPHSGRRMVK